MNRPVAVRQCVRAAVARPVSQLPTTLTWREPVPDVAVTGITLDSSQVQPGDLYCAPRRCQRPRRCFRCGMQSAQVLA